MSDPLLTNGPECLQVGYQGNSPIAFVCAQVNLDTGWSRITYMGLVPEARGKKFGAFVHRQGLKMLKQQGGKIYQGGTASVNKGMIRLFEANKCTHFETLTEFSWNRNG